MKSFVSSFCRMSVPHYRTSAKGRYYWSVLGDPAFLNKKEIDDGEKLRKTMTPRDWALEQVCTQLETYGSPTRPGWTVAEMVNQGKYNWESWIKDTLKKPKLTPDEQMYYQYHHMEELMKELLEKGFIEVVPVKP